MQLMELEKEVLDLVKEVRAYPPVACRPDWLNGLLIGQFFTGCQRHAAAKKNERNIYCIDCVECICQHCLGGHSGHRLLQVRRYVYHDVVRLQDVTKLVDCSGVQTYIINSAKVVFLNQRPQPRPTKGSNTCRTCDRGLQDEYCYCSLGCKVDAVAKLNGDLKPMLHKCTSFPALDIRSSSPTAKRSSSDVEMAETDVAAMSTSSFEDPGSTSSGSNGNDEGGVYYTSSADFFVAPRRSRTKCVLFHPYSPGSPTKQELSPRNRRKGTPTRSPAF